MSIGCSSTRSNSARVSGPGLSQIEFGTAVVPKSCTSAARRSVATVSSPHPRTRAASAASSAHRRLCPRHVRRLEIDEVRRHGRGRRRAPRRPGCGGARARARGPRPTGPAGEPIEPVARHARRTGRRASDRRCGRDALERPRARARREEAADRLHVVAEVHDTHRQRDRLAARVVGEALAVPALEREAQRLAHARRRSRAGATSMSPTSHPEAKLCTAHSWARLAGSSG